MKCVSETEILVGQQPPQGVLVCDHAGRVINKFSLMAVWRTQCHGRWRALIRRRVSCRSTAGLCKRSHPTDRLLVSRGASWGAGFITSGKMAGNHHLDQSTCCCASLSGRICLAKHASGSASAEMSRCPCQPQTRPAHALSVRTGQNAESRVSVWKRAARWAIMFPRRHTPSPGALRIRDV